MADRTVKVKLTGDVRDYTNSVERAAEKTEKLENKADKFSRGKYEAKFGADTKEADRKVDKLKGEAEAYDNGHHDAKFEADTKKAWTDIERLRDAGLIYSEERYTADFEAKTKKAEADLAQLRKDFRGLDGKKYTAAVKLQTKEARAEAKRLEKEIAGHTPKLELDITEAEYKRDKLTRSLARLNDSEWEAHVDADILVAEEKLNQLTREFGKLGQQKATPEVNLKAAQVFEQMNRIKRKLDDLKYEKANPSVELKKGDLIFEIVKIEERLGRLNAQKASPEVHLEAASAQAKLAVLERELSTLDHERVQPVVDVNVKKSMDRSRAMRQSLLAIAPAGVTAGAVAGGGILALGGPLSVITAGAGAAVLAFSGIGDAVEAINKYNLDPTAKNFKKMNQALDALSGTAQTFAKYIVSDVQPAIDSLQERAANGLLPGAQEGLEAAIRQFPIVADVVDQASQALGELAKRSGQALGDNTWQNFFNYLNNTARPALISMGESVGNFIEGLLNMGMAFDPVSQDMIAGLENMSQKFKAWSDGLGTNTGFQDFIDYVRENGPLVVDTIGKIVTVLGHIAEAAMPIGPVVLKGIGLLADILDKIVSIPGLGPVLASAATGLAGIGAASKMLGASRISAGAQAIGLVGTSAAAATPASKALGEGIKDLRGPFARLSPAANAAALSSTKLGTKMTQAGGKSAKLASGVSKAAGALPLIGTAVIGAMAAMDAMTTSYDEANEAMARGGQPRADMLNQMTEEQAHLDEVRNKYGGVIASMEQWHDENVRGSIGLEAYNAKEKERRDSLTATQRAQEDAKVAQGALNKAVLDFGPASSQARAATAEYADKLRDVKIEQLAESDGLSRDAAAIVVNAEARKKAITTMNAAKDATKEYNTAVKEHGAQSEQATLALADLISAQQQAATAALQSEGGMRAYVGSLRDLAAASGPELTGYLQQSISELDMTGVSAMGAKVSIDNMGRAVATLPSGQTVVLKADGRQAETQIQAVATALNNTPKDTQVTVGYIDSGTQAKIQALGIEVTKLPDGQIAVTAHDDQARATVSALGDWTAQQQVAPIDINADPSGFRARLEESVRNANNAMGMARINGDPALFRQQVDGLQGIVTGQAPLPMPIGTNPGQFFQDLGGFQADVQGMPPALMPLGANPAQANASTQQWRVDTEATRGVAQMDANPAAANQVAWRWNADTGKLEPVPGINANPAAATGKSNAWNAATAALMPVPGVDANPANANAKSRDWERFTAGMRPVPQVDADTSPATRAMNALKAAWNGARWVVNVVANKLGFAEGGIVQPMANGGIVNPPVIANDAGNNLSPYSQTYMGKRLRNMPNTGARMVNPNTWRVVGDRMDVPELYAPLDGSGRSLSLISEGARSFGYDLVKSDALYGSQGQDGARQIASAVRSVSQPVQVDIPRIMAAAGASSSKSVTNNVTVNNPIAERASDSVQRRLSSMADLGLFGDD